MTMSTKAQPDLRRVLTTPFYSRTAAACLTNEWSRWAGYTTVACYTDVELEYFAVRNQTGLFDLSPMIKYRIRGAGAGRYLNRLVTRDISRMSVGAVAYVMLCNDRGYVLDDGTLFRLGEADYRLCVQERHLPWLLDSALGFEVEIRDESAQIAALAVQGPTSHAVLEHAGFAGLETLRPFRSTTLEYRGAPILISRTGFTGDLGYELWLDPDQAESLWDDLMACNGLWDVRPFGSRALDMLRIEAGFLQPHVDFLPAGQALRPNRGRSPFELGFRRLVDFGKGHFIGRRALLAEQQSGSRFQIVRLDVDGNKPAGDALVYHNKSRQVGHITSAMWSPTCKRNIAIATLEAGRRDTWDQLWTEIYVRKEIKWRRTMARCRVVDGPFFRHPRRTATPPKSY